jgi:hypothetical protein
MTRPYIPTDQERGVSYRERLGIASIEQARAVEHPFMGSHITGMCFVCWQSQPSPRHGPIHFIAGGEFACDLRVTADATVPMSQRTRRRENASCPACLAVLAAHDLLEPCEETEDDDGR